MSLSVGIVGLPNAGKSSLFNALTRAGAAIAVYPFTTIEPHHGVAGVPDPRIEAIASVTHPDRTVHATVEFVDIAGLVRGAHRGEGLGNQFLAHIREVDAIVHVVRCFTAPDVPHVEGAVDPVRDIEVVETELALADLAVVERELERVRVRAKAQDARAIEHAAALETVAEDLKQGIPADRLLTDLRHAELLRTLNLLTGKPVLYVANIAETDLPAGACADAVARHAQARQAVALALSVKLEAEAVDLGGREAEEFLSAYGLAEPGLFRLIRAGYELLRLITFFTTASREVRAWPVPQGTRAPEAAGRIHTDMERGFIRAEVISWQTLVEAGSMQAGRERGLVRSEGRDYIVHDGDVMQFRFSA